MYGLSPSTEICCDRIKRSARTKAIPVAHRDSDPQFAYALGMEARVTATG
jgi:hypothetical protein